MRRILKIKTKLTVTNILTDNYDQLYKKKIQILHANSAET